MFYVLTRTHALKRERLFVFHFPDGSEKLFISGYSNAFLPNIWDLSKEKSPAL